MLTAISNGETIQIRDSDDTWKDLETVSFSESISEYRVKQNPIKGFGEMNIWFNPNGADFISLVPTSKHTKLARMKYEI